MTVPKHAMTVPKHVGGPSQRTVLEVLGPSSGGIRRHVATLARELPRHGWIPTVAAPSGVMDGIVSDIPAERLTEVEVSNSLNPRSIVAAVRSLRAVNRSAAGDGGFDLVHVHGLKAAMIALLARPGLPIVLTVHNVVLDAGGGLKNRLMAGLEAWITRSVDVVIGVSPEIVERCARDRGDRPTVFVLPASDAPVPRRTRAEVRSQLGVSEATTLIVVVARLHPQKDLLTFLRAWHELSADGVNRDAAAVIVGDGPQRQDIETEIDRLGLGDSVLLPGASAHAVDEIAAGEVLSLSSVWEGAPLVICEAMQLGKPIVSTDVGVIAEMVGDLGGRIVDVGDVTGLASALRTVIDNTEDAAEMGRINKERGTSIYGSGPLVGRIAEVYEEMLTDEY